MKDNKELHFVWKSGQYDDKGILVHLISDHTYGTPRILKYDRRWTDEGDCTFNSIIVG
jgi:hypothetical protein